ncbi:IS5 family transposase [Limobrevibacterium gyesilva]|uniref:IS5 family transposase n=1 Tax=Limobrevibacterium gyesilva TaxID=2991712 RepID=A0AA41YQD0_9PROT|nr:IS5 family transposase [Limobrevibacterium gyesilva]MCW3474698.1 IS5 family transposase [Limobrevibacterium gyesilva]
MRGADEQSVALFSYLSPDVLAPRDHPLRSIWPLVNAALAQFSPKFDALYAGSGRNSIAPEKLLRALLPQAFYGVRSGRQLMEQVIYNMLFRWFIGLSMDAPVWDVTVFTNNCERLLACDIAVSFLLAVMGDPAVKQLLLTEHFSVGGPLIEAWASMKNFRRKHGSDDDPSGPGRNAERDFRGEKRSNETHAPTTDPDARLYRKSDGQPSRLCFMGNLLIENRHGLIIDVRTTHATGRAEHETVEAIIQAAKRGRRATLGADKAYDAAEHIARLRAIGVMPLVTQHGSGRRSAIDGRTTRHAGYGISQHLRKRIEKSVGWIRATAGLRHTRHRRLARVGWVVTLTAAACNLVRLPKLLASAA